MGKYCSLPHTTRNSIVTFRPEWKISPEHETLTLFSSPPPLCVGFSLFFVHFHSFICLLPSPLFPLYSPVSYDPPPYSSLSILAWYLPSVHGLIHPPLHQLCWTLLIEAFAQRVFNSLVLPAQSPLLPFILLSNKSQAFIWTSPLQISHLPSFFAALVGPFPQSIFIVVGVCMSMCVSNLCTVK